MKRTETEIKLSGSGQLYEQPIMEDADAVRAEYQAKARKLAWRWTLDAKRLDRKSFHKEATTKMGCAAELERRFGLEGK